MGLTAIKTDLTQEQLWKLRQEVKLGSNLTNDFNNSFDIPASNCQVFFDGYLEEISQKIEADGHYEQDWWDYVSKYDLPETLWDWYNMCEAPFGYDFGGN